MCLCTRMPTVTSRHWRLGFAPGESCIYTSALLREERLGQTREESASAYSHTTQIPCAEPWIHCRASDDLGKHFPILNGGKRELSFTFLQNRGQNKWEHPLPTPSQWIQKVYKRVISGSWCHDGVMFVPPAFIGMTLPPAFPPPFGCSPACEV